MWETLGIYALWVGGACSTYLILALIFYELRRRTNTFIAANNFSKSGNLEKPNEIHKAKR